MFNKFFLGLLECSFYKLKVFAHCPKRTREFFFQKFLLKIFLWRRKMKVCQPCPKKLARRPKYFSVRVRKRIENLNHFLNIGFVEEFIWTREVHFWPAHWNRILTKSVVFSFDVWKRLKKPSVIFHEFFFQKCSSRHVESSFEKSAEKKFDTKSKTFRPMSENF